MGHRTEPDLRTTGLHHITAICSDAKRNVAFYTRVLNLRLVKKTVNQDDVSAYHLYYGDETGSPGTLITFFTWKLARGRTGSPSATSISFAVEDLGAWKEHLIAKNVAFESSERFGTEALFFTDPEGLELVLIERAMPLRSSIGQPAMLGVCGVRLSVDDPSRSLGLLESFGYDRGAEHEGIVRYEHASSSTFIEVVASSTPAIQGAGSVHHIAFGIAPDDDERMQRALVVRGVSPTPIVERFYFRSIYFREPSGALFEIATNGPGFFIDEDVPGSTLVLPPWFEPHRKDIEARLEKL